MTPPFCFGAGSKLSSFSEPTWAGFSPAPSPSMTWMATDQGPGTLIEYSSTGKRAAVQAPHGKLQLTLQLPTGGLTRVGVPPESRIGWMASPDPPTVPDATLASSLSVPPVLA